MELFLQKEHNGFQVWEYQVNNKIPCSEEEKKIYGVDYKIDPHKRNPFIVLNNFKDGGEYYSAHIFEDLMPDNFKCLHKAQEYMIKEWKKLNKND